MKILMILWAIGLSKCEKLDRTYLPPPGSVTAGGQPGDLNLPLEFTREQYSSTSEPGRDIITTNGSLSSKYPNIALGIDRQSPYATGSPTFFTNDPGVPVTKGSNNVPISGYGVGQTTSSPIRTYGTTIGPQAGDFQRYSTTSPSPDPNLSYGQDSIQKTINPYNPSQSLKNAGFVSRDSNLRDDSVQQSPTFQYSTITTPTENISYPDKFYNEKSIDTNLNIPMATGSIINNPAATNTAEPSFKYSSLPMFSNDSFDARYNTNNIPQRKQAESDRNAVILNYENVITPDGFAYSFDTSNGIHVDESGTAVDGVRAKGSYSYVGDDGKIYNIEYTADENGFQPRGDHLPTAPPIPSAILKGIEEAERNRKLGIIDDGSYDDTKYGHGRYQGLMGRIPQNKYADFTENQPDLIENVKQGKTISLEKEDLTTNNADFVGAVDYDLSVKSNSPKMDKIGEIYNKYSDAVGRSKVLPQSEGNNQLNENNLPSSKLNKFDNESPLQKSENFLPINSQKEYDGENINMQYQSGYEYIAPKYMFTDDDKNSFLNTRIDNKSKPDEAQYEITTANTFVTPTVSFNFKDRKPDTNAQSSRFVDESFKDPTITPGSTNTAKIPNINIAEFSPNNKLFYNKGPGQNQNIKNYFPERVFSTEEPKYASTTLRPYYQPSSTFNGNPIDKQRNNYPSSIPVSQFSGSTTPLPSEFSSSFIPSTSSDYYSETTPTISQVTSTFRPSITSGQSTSDTTSRPFGYIERLSKPGQVDDTRIPSINPDSFGQRVTIGPGYQGRPNKIPVNQNRLSEDFTGGTLGLQGTSYPRNQNSRVSSQPKNFGGQSSAETVFGEDFSGPKRPQKFDPQNGYYY